MNDRSASGGQDAVCLLPARGDLEGAAGGAAGANHRVGDVVVQSPEAGGSRRHEIGGSQASQDAVMAGGGVVVDAARGRVCGYPHPLPLAAGSAAWTGSPSGGRLIKSARWLPVRVTVLWSQAGGEPVVGQLAEPAATDESDQLAAQEFQPGLSR
ncbi:hypothetical protein [Streptomyces sp. NPDC088719]|uniref:hypothetical protein n=1 Tax=Streptomyces sp. NPDC088719 TaxID=3365872 RepID=UPI00380F4749